MLQVYVDIQTEKIMYLIERKKGFYCFKINKNEYIVYDKKAYKTFCRPVGEA